MMSKHVPSALGELHHVCNKTARIALFLPLDTTTSGKHSFKRQNRAGPSGSSVLLSITTLYRAGPAARLRLQGALTLSSCIPHG